MPPLNVPPPEHISFSRHLRRLLLAPLLLLPALAAANDAPTVAVVPVTRGEIFKEVSFDAELRPYKEIELHARVTGYLDKMLVDAGDVVKEGQLLAQLDVPELNFDLLNAQASERRAQADVDKAAATFEEARLALTRLEAADKAQPNLIAKQDIDSARLRAQAAKAACSAFEETHTAAEGSVKRLQTMLDFTRITAPFEGVITRRYSDPGALIQAGTSSGSMPLVRLSQVDLLRVAFPISVSYVAGVNDGDEAEVLIPSLAKKITAKISRLSQKVETSTRTMEAQIDLPNPDGNLIAGVYATVTLKVGRKNNVLTLPVTAVAQDKGAASVFLVSKDHKIEKRDVQVGLESPTHVEILQGLAEGDLVMIGSKAQFSNGQSVQPKQVAQMTSAKP